MVVSDTLGRFPFAIAQFRKPIGNPSATLDRYTAPNEHPTSTSGGGVMTYGGRVVEIMERHTRSDGVLMVLTRWYDARTGHNMTTWVRADEVTP